MAAADHVNFVNALNAEFLAREGRKRRARVITFGCKLNENDSEKVMGLLKDMGFEIDTPPVSGKFGNPAPLGDLYRLDAVILNTCSVRDNAERRLFGILGSLKKFKEDDPARVVGVCGCMAQEAGAVSEIQNRYGFVDFIFGTGAIPRLPELLRRTYEARPQPFPRPYTQPQAQPYTQTQPKPYTQPQPQAQPYTKPRPQLSVGAATHVWNELPETVAEGLPFHRKAPPLALVSIMTGCDNFCSYCIVPYVRGREKSRAPEDIIAEVRALAEAGYREITLLGQNVNSYDGGLSCDFAELLERLSAVGGIARVRFMTSHPKDLSDRLIAAVAAPGPVCPHVHLPVQSGSSEVLARMNRGYDREDYLGLVRRLRSAVPDIALTTDVIVGFPGETEENFNDTLRLVAEAEFDSCFTFLYSPRAGTPAADYPDRVTKPVAQARFLRLVELQNAVSLKKNLACVGKTYEVLCEGGSKTNPDRMAGRTPGGKLVNFTVPYGEAAPAGQTVAVRIDGARTWSLDGSLVGGSVLPQRT